MLQNSHYLVELKDCLVQDQVIQAIANDFADLLTYYQIPIADERKELGVRTIDGSTSSEVWSGSDNCGHQSAD